MVGGIPMQNRLRLAALLALALVFPLRALSAQEVLRTDRLPVGFAVTAVSDGGRGGGDLRSGHHGLVGCG